MEEIELYEHKFRKCSYCKQYWPIDFYWGFKDESTCNECNYEKRQIRKYLGVFIHKNIKRKQKIYIRPKFEIPKCYDDYLKPKTDKWQELLAKRLKISGNRTKSI